MDRLSVILDQLGGNGSASVEDLARLLGVSGATVRRDLRQLADQHLLVRTHGGAAVQAVSYELPIRYRSGRRSEQKRRIGAAAAELVADRGVAGITGGTTTTETARALASRADLTIVTNALNIAAELAVRPNLRLVVTGGIARSASFELVGPVAEQTLSGYNLDVAFVGVDGINASAGCTTHDDVEARTNAILVRQARQCVVVADSSKLGTVAFAQICPITDVNVLITDSDAGEAQLKALRGAGVEIRLV
jgi:DeoR family transcriptional regulator, aga operon transcriptional repressor